LKGTGAMRINSSKTFRYSDCCASSEVCDRAGRPRVVTDSRGADALCALAFRLMTVRPELPPALVGLGPLPRVSYALVGCHRRTHSPGYSRPFYGDVVTRLTCASASHSPATAPPGAESIGRPRHYGRDPFSRSHTRPARPGSFLARAQSATTRRFAGMSGASLEVFVPFSVRWPRSRPRASGGRQPPWDDPASTFRHLRPALSRSHGPAGVTCVLAGFRSRRTRRDEARVADVPARALEPNPSLALHPVSAVSSPRTRRWNTDALPRCFDLIRVHGTWRRLDGLLPVLAVRLRPFVRV